MKFEFWNDKYEIPLISIVVILCISVLTFSFFTKFTFSYDNTNWQIVDTQPVSNYQPALIIEQLAIYPIPAENAFDIYHLSTKITQRRNARSPILEMRTIPILNADGYHVAWRTTTNELWHAQLANDGEFLLFPERLSEVTVSAFDIAPIPSGGAMVVWRSATEFTNPLSYAMLTPDGIPYRQGRWLRDVDQFSLRTAPSGEIVLIWLSNIQTTQRLNYTQFDFDTFRYGLDTVLTDDIRELNIFVPDSVWISDFTLVGTPDNWVAVWGQTTLDTLEQTDYFALSLTADAQPIPLRLKDTRWRWLGEIGYSDPTQQTAEIVLNGYVDEAWRPVRLQIDATGIQNMEILTDFTAEGSRSRLWIGANPEDVFVSWLRLNEHQEIVQSLAVSQPNASVSVNETEETHPQFLNLLLEGIGWLILPLWILVAPLGWTNSQRRFLMVLGYWTVKLGLSLNNLHIPPDLFDIGLNARSRIGLATSLAAVLPLVWFSWHKRFAWQVSIMAYLVSEMLLTIMLFAKG